MVTVKIQPVVHVYKEINEGKYKSVRHYELKDVQNGKNQLTELINISKDRGFAKSMPDYWLKLKEGKKWGANLTGLFKTTYKGIYIGDTQKKKNLIVFQFPEDEGKLVVHVFTGYYTTDLTTVLPILEQ